MLVDDETMPRLAAVVRDALTGFDVQGVQVVLDTEGGVEAWLAGRKLVLGAGALAVFSQAELPYLLALALALGSSGEALRRPGEVPGFDEAASAAFEAWPGSLAACRVLAQLDARVRGQDPASVDVGAVLREGARRSARSRCGRSLPSESARVATRTRTRRSRSSQRRRRRT